MTGLEAFIVPALTGLGVTAETAGTVGTVANVAATASALGGTVAGYLADKNMNEAAAADAKRKAAQEMAVASKKAEEERHKKEVLLSKQQARLAASGAGLGGTAAEIMAETEAKGDYNAELELWQGQQRANAAEDEAKLSLYRSKQEGAALPFKLGSNIITGVTNQVKMTPRPFGDTIIDSNYDPDSGFYTTTRKSLYRFDS